MSDAILILVGAGLVIAGLAISGSGRKDAARTENKNIAITFSGSIEQTIQYIGMAMKGERQRTARDWIGWGLSAGGLVVGLVGLVS